MLEQFEKDGEIKKRKSVVELEKLKADQNNLMKNWIAYLKGI